LSRLTDGIQWSVLTVRQVHLIQCELFDELHPAEFTIAPGQIGENITTRGIDLLGLPKGTKLQVGIAAVV
jgi:MOSC domain-containing protein YiiM